MKIVLGIDLKAQFNRFHILIVFLDLLCFETQV